MKATEGQDADIRQQRIGVVALAVAVLSGLLLGAGLVHLALHPTQKYVVGPEALGFVFSAISFLLGCFGWRLLLGKVAVFVSVLVAVSCWFIPWPMAP